MEETAWQLLGRSSTLFGIPVNRKTGRGDVGHVYFTGQAGRAVLGVHLWLSRSPASLLLCSKLSSPKSPCVGVLGALTIIPAQSQCFGVSPYSLL